MQSLKVLTNILNYDIAKTLIPENEIGTIKKEYPNKKIGFYIIFGTGEYGYLDSEGTKNITYVLPDTVIQTYEKIKNKGGNVYDRHLTTEEILNNIDDRKPIGKIIKHYLINKNSNYYIMSAVIFNKNEMIETRFKNASLEGIPKFENGNLRYIDILSFAVFNEESGTRQLYKDAGLIYTIVSYETNQIINKIQSNIIEIDNKTNDDKIYNKGVNMNLEEIKKYVYENKIYPHQIFDSDKILGNIIIDENGLRFEGGDVRITDIIIKKLKNNTIVDKNAYTDLLKVKKDFETIYPKYIEYETVNFRNQAKDIINNKAQSLNIDKKAMKFLLSEETLKRLKLVEPEKREEAIDSYIKENLKFYNEIIEIMKDDDSKEQQKEESNKNNPIKFTF